jgi:L-iditol 2-dehydrogenase
LKISLTIAIPYSILRISEEATKAAVLEQLGVIEVKEVPDPPLLPGSLRVKVEACAICGSDIRIYRKGDYRATLPRILGHEIVGTVEELGRGTKGFRVGDRVAVAPGHGCGRCVYCRNGMENVCIDARPSIGYASSGGFAQYIVPPVNVVEIGFVNHLPDGLPFEKAALSELLACCINGQERAAVGAGDVVVVMGAGPAGCFHIELARARGASKVILVQRSTARLDFARTTLCPDVATKAAGAELVDLVKSETGGIGANAVIVAAPSPEAQEVAVSLAAPRGRVVFFGGLPKDRKQISIDANVIHYLEIDVTGASSSLARQNREALQMIADGRVRAEKFITHRFGLEKTPEAFALVERKEACKALVFPWS